MVLDTIAGDYGPRSLDTLNAGGILIDVRGTGPDRTAVRRVAQERGLRFVQFKFQPSAADLGELAGLVESGVLRVVVDQVFPLEHAAKAHELSETGRVTGKVVLSLSESGTRRTGLEWLPVVEGERSPDLVGKGHGDQSLLQVGSGDPGRRG